MSDWMLAVGQDQGERKARAVRLAAVYLCRLYLKSTRKQTGKTQNRQEARQRLPLL